MTRPKVERKKADVETRDSYVLRLYIAGMAPRSTLAIRNIRALCEERLAGRYDLKVIDIYQQPVLAAGAQIVAAPTLVKQHPLPVRRFVGDMSNTERLVSGMDLRLVEPSPPPQGSTEA